MNAARYSFYSDAGMGVEPTHDRDGAYVEHEDYAYALHEIDRLEAENVEVRSRLSAMPHDGGHATTCWIWGEGPMRGHEGNPGGVCSCGYLWLYWRGRAEEAEAKIEKLVAAGDDMRQEWCGHNHGMMGTKAPRSCGRCVVEEAWDRAKGEDEGK
jgi:hypothetical protein